MTLVFLIFVALLLVATPHLAREFSFAIQRKFSNIRYIKIGTRENYLALCYRFIVSDKFLLVVLTFVLSVVYYVFVAFLPLDRIFLGLKEARSSTDVNVIIALRFFSIDVLIITSYVYFIVLKYLSEILVYGRLLRLSSKGSEIFCMLLVIFVFPYLFALGFALSGKNPIISCFGCLIGLSVAALNRVISIFHDENASNFFTWAKNSSGVEMGSKNHKFGLTKKIEMRMLIYMSFGSTLKARLSFLAGFLVVFARSLLNRITKTEILAFYGHWQNFSKKYNDNFIRMLGDYEKQIESGTLLSVIAQSKYDLGLKTEAFKIVDQAMERKQDIRYVGLLLLRSSMFQNEGLRENSLYDAVEAWKLSSYKNFVAEKRIAELLLNHIRAKEYLKNIGEQSLSKSIEYAEWFSVKSCLESYKSFKRIHPDCLTLSGIAKYLSGSVDDGAYLLFNSVSYYNHFDARLFLAEVFAWIHGDYGRSYSMLIPILASNQLGEKGKKQRLVNTWNTITHCRLNKIEMPAQTILISCDAVGKDDVIKFVETAQNMENKFKLVIGKKKEKKYGNIKPIVIKMEKMFSTKIQEEEKLVIGPKMKEILDKASENQLKLSNL